MHLEIFVGNHPEDLIPVHWRDVDFAGCIRTSKSTSGGLDAMVGSRAFAPLAPLCKKQMVVSHSSTEAEIVSLDTCIRTQGLTLISFWEHVVRVLGSKQPNKPGRHMSPGGGVPKNLRVLGNSLMP